ncbi:hypothetical protein PR202_ga14263 [Eleusine coracana subsp. coracana]|uniref:Uncharacterized protein n=1 Tax=Eleusine coracana subsp. coracana TaxID=191504 RepID=A0AAV5CG60_ELECO|nr:hypothetical protein PR202_ga14263 [Eleusine coracana subsp. coracana]
MARRSSPGGGWVACCLAFLLKLLAFLQAFAAVSALLYAAWILSRWARHHDLHLHDLLPDLWFPSAVMAAGLFYSLLLLAGYLAAEINTGCCLCFYTIPAMAMLLLEAALAAHLTLNQHWIQELPYDHTGELDNLLSFIHNNLDLCKWAALAVFATQSADCDSDEDFVVIRRPLLVAQAPQPYLPITVDARGFRPDLWSSRMRQKVTTVCNLISIV